MRVDDLRWAGLVLLLCVGAVPSALRGQPLPDTLTFDRARTLLQSHNPQLQAAEAGGRATGQAARARSLFPNPTPIVSEERTNLAGSGVADQWYRRGGVIRASDLSVHRDREAGSGLLRMTGSTSWLGGIAGKVRTGRQGDEKIVVLPVHHSIDIRTFAGSGEAPSG